MWWGKAKGKNEMFWHQTYVWGFHGAEANERWWQCFGRGKALENMQMNAKKEGKSANKQETRTNRS